MFLAQSGADASHSWMPTTAYREEDDEEESAAATWEEKDRRDQKVCGPFNAGVSVTPQYDHSCVSVILTACAKSTVTSVG